MRWTRSAGSAVAVCVCVRARAPGGVVRGSPGGVWVQKLLEQADWQVGVANHQASAKSITHSLQSASPPYSQKCLKRFGAEKQGREYATLSF